MEIPPYELHKICRICLKSDLLVSIFSPSVSFLLTRPIEMIEKLNIFKPDDNLPTLLCQSCLYRLLDAHNLQQLAEESERRLREYLSTSGSGGVGVECVALNPNNFNQETSSLCSTIGAQCMESPQSKEAIASAAIYANICDMFERNVAPPPSSSDVEDVLNDVEIDVSSLTRSEADDTLGEVFVGGVISAGDHLDFNCSSLDLVVQENISNSNDFKQQKSSPLMPFCKQKTKVLKNPDKCLECGKTFNYSGYLEAHKRTHTGEKPFKCKLCPRSFTQASNFRLHQRTHTGERRRFQCEICAGFFTTSSNLKAHRQTHLERRDFQCMRCERCFKTLRELSRHEPVHKATKDIVCDVCQKAFTKRSYLNAHMAAMHRDGGAGGVRMRRHKCTECAKEFGNRSNLTCHMRTHTGEKPFQCKYCVWKFNQSSALVRHMRKHTKSTNDNADLKPINQNNAFNNSLLNNYLQQPATIATNKSSANSYNLLHALPIIGEVVLNGNDSTPLNTSLHGYDFTKDVILDFSTNQQQNQTHNIY